MTDAEKELVLLACARGAELWALGSVMAAESWFGVALDAVGTRDFVDTDEEANR